MSPEEFVDTFIDFYGIGREWDNGLLNLTTSFRLSTRFKEKVLPVKFGKVGGDFDISNTNIESLAGCPHSVTGNFLANCINIKTLDGGPQVVSESYVAQYNPYLKSLRGAPQFVGMNFSSHNIDSDRNAYETRYLLLSRIKGEIRTGNEKIDYILQYGRDENWDMPSELIPGKIKELRGLS